MTLKEYRYNLIHRAICYALLQFIVVDAALAQGNYSIKHYNTENGLPQNSITDIDVDSSGFVWIGTENGLVRFDGQHFRVFNLFNSPVLKNTDRIAYMSTDDKSHIYFNNALFYTYEIVNPNTLKQVGQFKESEYILTTNKGLADYQQLVAEFAALSPAGSNINFLRNGVIRNGIYKINNEEVYGVFDSILYKKGNVTLKALTEDDNTKILNDTVYHTNQNRTVDVYYKQAHLTDKFLFTGDMLADSLYSNPKNHLKTMRGKKAWLAQLGNNYYTIKRVGSALQTTLLFKNLVLPLFQNLYYDGLHNQYFFGTASDGFYIVKTSGFTNIYQQLPSNRPSRNAFSSEVLLPGDSILISKGILFDKAGQQKKVFMEWGDAGVADTGGIWYGLDGFAMKFNAAIKPILQIKGSTEDFLLFCKDTATGSVYCASAHAIKKINQQTKTLEPFNVPLFAKERVWHISMQSANNMWVGTDNGLYILNVQTLQLQKIKGSDGKTVRNVFNDAQTGIAWAGTYGHGPCYVKDGTLYTLPLDRDRNLLYSHYFYKDKKGYMWIPTNKGLYQASVTGLMAYVHGTANSVYYQYYNTTDGFASNEFNGGFSGPWALRSDGILSLCSMKGLVWFTPEKIVPEQPGQPIYIDQLQVDGRDTSFNGQTLLPAYYSQFAINITTPYFGNEKNLFLEYQIEDGHNNTWLPVPATGQIILSKLSPDDYTIQVRKMAGFNGQYQYASLTFEVLPAWYQSVWFYTIVALAAVGAILLLVRLRLNTLIARKKELETLVDERTTALTNTVTQLSTSQHALVESNKIKDTMVGLVLHDLRSPIRFMNTVLKHIAKNRSQMDEHDMEESIVELNRASASLNDFAEEFFTWVSSQHDQFKVHNTSFALQEIFYDIQNLYGELFATRGNICSFEANGVVCNTDKNILHVIVRNLVDNANKNTTSGTITVRAVRQGEKTYITVTDTGKGMEESLVNSIQEGRFIASSSQFGYRMITSMLGKINGLLAIESKLGSGTSVSIVLG